MGYVGMSANDTQVGGDHYKMAGKLEHWDIVAQHDLDYFQGQVTKYVMRWKKKGGLQDLMKAKHFLQKYIEVEEKKQRDSAAENSACEQLQRGNIALCTCHYTPMECCAYHAGLAVKMK